MRTYWEKLVFVINKRPHVIYYLSFMINECLSFWHVESFLFKDWN